MRRTAAAAPMAAVAVIVLLATTPAAAGGPAPLEQARRAAENTSFEGVLEVRWRDGDIFRTERLGVQAAGGALMVKGANLVMAGPAFGRLLAHGGKGWEEMWLPSRAPSPRPDGGAKYQTTAPTDGPQVAGRPTRMYEVLHHGRLLERIYLDTETGLLLERDQYDQTGALVRTLTFRSITVGVPAEPPRQPGSPAHHAPKVVSPDRVDRVAAPPVLAEGYERMGVYKSGGVLQALYSDGVYDLSLFQQPGRLRRSDLPGSGVRVTVAGATGWRYPWPGGQLVLWSAGGRVYTAVSDAPAEHVLAAVNALPRVPSREPSLLAKIRRASQALMEPLS
jgi:hypothetical protein